MYKVVLWLSGFVIREANYEQFVIEQANQGVRIAVYIIIDAGVSMRDGVCLCGCLYLEGEVFESLER